jgi:hypothetical protein
MTETNWRAPVKSYPRIDYLGSHIDTLLFIIIVIIIINIEPVISKKKKKIIHDK